MKSSNRLKSAVSCGVADLTKNFPFKCEGNFYGQNTVSALQPDKVSVGCQNSNSKEWKSLQIQYQLPHHLDSEVSEEATERESGRSA